MATIAIKAFRQETQARRGSTLLRAAIVAWRAYAQVRLARRQLLAMSERELRDIGINRLEALREAERPVWRDAFAAARRWIGGGP